MCARYLQKEDDMKSSRVAWALAALLLLADVWVVEGTPLAVSDFASLGAFPSGPGSYTVNTSGLPTLIGPGVNIAGVVGPDAIAVFAFSNIQIGDGFTLTATGNRPLALLSYGDVTISGTGLIGVSGMGSIGGPGGGAGGAIGGLPGSGPGGGGPGTGGLGIPAAGGGGFGGAGGAGGAGGLVGGGAGGAGGLAYGDLSLVLQGGSGGGSGSTNPFFPGLTGGGGGGAVEIGALGAIFIDGLGIRADGGNGTGVSGGGFTSGIGNSGAGSGGAILLHAQLVTLTAALSAHGGAGGSGNRPGGGGGGLVLILTAPGGFTGGGPIDVSGGAGGVSPSVDSGPDGIAGSPGRITITEGPLPVPGPATLSTLAIGALILVRCRRHARRRSDAGNDTH
jgi:hypothetical protein